MEWQAARPEAASTMLTQSRHRAVRNFSVQLQLSYKLNQPGRSSRLDVQVPTHWQMNLEKTFDKFLPWASSGHVTTRSMYTPRC